MNYLYLGLLLVFVSPASWALEWRDLWETRDQQAAQAFRQENYEQAAGKFDHRQWKAAAEYKAGDYEQVLKTLEGDQSSTALYNKGNAHAQLGQYQEALSAYEQAISKDPGNSDAQHNKEIIEQALSRQKQQNNQQQNNGEKGQQDEQSQQNQQDGQQNNQQDSEQGDDQRNQSGFGQEHENDSAEQENGSNHEQMQEDGKQQDQQHEQQHDNQQAEQDSEEEQKEGEDNQMEHTGDAYQNPPDDAKPADEQQQAYEQWLKRIPDDPGGLLKRKFKYQYQQRQRTR